MYIYNDSDNESISANYLKDIRDGSQIRTDINIRDSRLEILYCIKQIQSEWKVTELSSKSMCNFLHKLFNYVVH